MQQKLPKKKSHQNALFLGKVKDLLWGLRMFYCELYEIPSSSS